MTRLLLLAGVALTFAGPVAAQDLTDRAAPPAPPAGASTAPAPTPGEDQVQFSAGSLEYDYNADIVTAQTDVRMTRRGDRLRADKVVWNRKSGRVLATGNVAVTNPQGDVAYGNSIDLADSLRDGVVENMLVVLERGGRLAAVKGTRDKDRTVFLDRAAYTPCAVTDGDGCPKEPTLKVTAPRVTYRRQGARLFHAPAHPPVRARQSRAALVQRRDHREQRHRPPHPQHRRVAAQRGRGGRAVQHRAVAQPVARRRAAYLQRGAADGGGALAHRGGIGALSLTAYGTQSRKADNLSSGFASNTSRGFRGYLDGTGGTSSTTGGCRGRCGW
ncbi:hypothetical protein AB5I41_05595 [Sphingomonas sp. MMS24-JH45]